jgi:hypothetical protein
MIQYNLKPLISTTIDVTFRKLMVVQCVHFCISIDSRAKNISNKKFENPLQLITFKPRYNATSNFAHQITWTAIPSYILYLFTALK